MTYKLYCIISHAALNWHSRTSVPELRARYSNTAYSPDFYCPLHDLIALCITCSFINFLTFIKYVISVYWDY